MMFGEKNCAIVTQAGNFGANGPSQVELFAEPSGQDARKCGKSARSHRQIRLEHPRELRDRLVVEHDRIEVLGFELSEPQAKLDGITGKALVVLLAGESFFLGGGNYLAI